MKVRRYGWDSLLLEVDAPAAWAEALKVLPCEEIVPGAGTVLIRGYTGPIEITPPDVTNAPQETIEIPTVWNGPDADVIPIQVMRDTTFTVAFCGFLPGFAYLTGMPAEFHVPRLATPREKVPAGSVAIAGPYAGIYPRSSPGGWHLLGTTSITLFDLHADPPALLRPGMQIRFTDA